MRQIRDDLHETEAFSPFGGLITHAYLWTGGPDGNVLLYNTGTTEDFDAIDELGGVAHQYPSHQDEFGPMFGELAERFGNALYVAEPEAAIAARFRTPTATFTERHHSPAGIEVIPTPGHTVGSTSFVVEGTGGLRYLFTGDTLFVSRGDVWRAGYIPGHSDAEQLAATLDLYATLEVDVVVSSAAPTGVGAHEVTGRWLDVLTEAREGLLART